MPSQFRRDQILGGAVGFIDETLNETVEYIVGGTPVNEGPGSARDLENLISPAEFKTKFPTSGEITDFQNARSLEKSDEELLREKREAVTLADEIMTEYRLNQMQTPLEIKRTKINQLNELQESYQGSVDTQGNATIYHEANAEQKEIENKALKIQSGREQKLSQARGKATPGFQMRQGELEMGIENPNHFTQHKG